MASLLPLRAHAELIWRYGVASVDAQQLVRAQVSLDGDVLSVAGDRVVDLSRTERIVVVGAGKAGVGMALGFESVLGDDLLRRVEGWVNVPENCVRQSKKIHLHAARPTGVNEPCGAGVKGTREIARLVRSLTECDVCIVLISGGGSALLPAPADGVTLEDKLAVTRLLMSSGVTINELNCVRSHLSQLKGGGLVREAGPGQVVSLIVSDVVGDPLEVIASGPTVACDTSASDALAILERYGDHVPRSVLDVLRRGDEKPPADFSRVSNHIVGNNQTAISACAAVARKLGYSVIDLGSDNEGVASDVGVALADAAIAARDSRSPARGPVCILSGGEPVVHLCDSPGRGGRNQEVVLAALERLGTNLDEQIVVLSGGSDGEDGPTDAAGGMVSCETAAVARKTGLVVRDFLEKNDAYTFLAATDSLLMSPSTDTNVMDIRVVLIG